MKDEYIDMPSLKEIKEELEGRYDLIEEVGERLSSVVPNITIRNNQNVYVTINNFNETEKQWAERKDE